MKLILLFLLTALSLAAVAEFPANGQLYQFRHVGAPQPMQNLFGRELRFMRGYHWQAVSYYNRERVIVPSAFAALESDGTQHQWGSSASIDNVRETSINVQAGFNFSAFDLRISENHSNRRSFQTTRSLVSRPGCTFAPYIHGANLHGVTYVNLIHPDGRLEPLSARRFRGLLFESIHSSAWNYVSALFDSRMYARIEAIYPIDFSVQYEEQVFAVCAFSSRRLHNTQAQDLLDECLGGDSAAESGDTCKEITPAAGSIVGIPGVTQ